MENCAVFALYGCSRRISADSPFEFNFVSGRVHSKAENFREGGSGKAPRKREIGFSTENLRGRHPLHNPRNERDIAKDKKSTVERTTMLKYKTMVGATGFEPATSKSRT